MLQLHVETQMKELARLRQSELCQVADRGLRSLDGYVSDLLGRGQVRAREVEPALQLTGAAGDVSTRIKRIRFDTGGENSVQLPASLDQETTDEALSYGHMSPGTSSTIDNPQDITDLLCAELRTQKLIF